MFIVVRDLIYSYCPVHLFDIHTFQSIVMISFLVFCTGECSKASLEVVIVLFYVSASLTVGGGAKAKANRCIERTSMRETIMQNDQKGSGSGETHSGSQD